jgi:hypothetical protein
LLLAAKSRFSGSRIAPRTANRIREFVPDDIPGVVALFERVYPAHRWDSAEACGQYLREILFGNPWRAADLPSWVSEENGRIAGFAGVVPRPMLFRGRPIRAAVGCLYMVDPDRRSSLIALQLLRAALAGPQDLFVADGSNDDARRLCISAGGSAPLLYSLHWTRPLRPAQYALSLLRGFGGPWSAAARALAPLGGVADAVLARVRPHRLQPGIGDFTDVALDPAVAAASLPEMLRANALRPACDAAEFAWLLEQAALKTRHGRFRGRAVLDAAGQLAGWFLYYAQPGSVAEVLQLVARDGAYDGVLRHLLSDAHAQGATAVRGRFDPAHAQELSDRHCWLRREGAWTLIHSRDAEIISAFERGDAEFSRLDGEWWLRFLGG